MQEQKEEQKSRKPRITARYNLRYFSAYCWNRTKKKYPQYTQTDISRAIMMYYELAREDLAKGMKINMSNKLGNLYLSKEKRGVTFNPETGIIRNTLPINIGETSKLWRDKPELKNKTFIRYTNDHSDNFYFSLHYQLSKAIYKNKNVYDFKFNRGLKKKLVTNIHDKQVDAYLIPNYKDEQ